MGGVFVAGTDTGVGKTIITGCLARYLIDQGCTVITQKWAQSGCTGGFSPDIDRHLEIMGKDRSYVKDYLNLVCPYKFKFPVSPHLAGIKENRRIEPDKIIKSYFRLAGKFKFVIVEGIGGVMVPLSRRILLIDLIQQSGLPVLIVAQNKLGAINHTLLTIEALKERKIDIVGVVFNNVQKENLLITVDNPRIVGALSKIDILGVLPWVENPKKLYRDFAPIARKIFRKLNRG